MSPFLVKIVYKPIIKRAARAALVGRNRDRLKPENGRLTHADLVTVLGQTWRTYDELAPSVRQEPTLGSRMNVLLACLTLSFYKALTAIGIEQNYAIELVGDAAWKIYARWGRLPIFIARSLTRAPAERLRMAVNLFLRFPFTPPGYVFERLPNDDGISLDMLRCPVAEFFQTQHATDVCLGTWCNLDFALAEMWGGQLERTGTLAAGCTHCDFRFKATEKVADKKTKAYRAQSEVEA